MYIFFKLHFNSENKKSKQRKTISLPEHRHPNVLGQGGLWKVSEDVISLFSVAEAYFLSSTKKLQNKIMPKNIVSALMENYAILESFAEVRKISLHNIKKGVAFNFLSCPPIFPKSEIAKQNQDLSEHPWNNLHHLPLKDVQDHHQERFYLVKRHPF